MAKKKTFSFAHLIGLGPSASEEEEDKKAKKAKARRAEEDEREDDADVVHAEVFRRAQAQQNIRDQQQIEVLAAQRDPCQHAPNRQ